MRSCGVCTETPGHGTNCDVLTDENGESQVARNPEFRKDIGKLMFHGAFGYRKPDSDLLIRQPGGDFSAISISLDVSSGSRINLDGDRNKTCRAACRKSARLSSPPNIVLKECSQYHYPMPEAAVTSISFH